IVAALAVAAFVGVEWYMAQFRAGGGTPEFYQAEFSPAVMQACGRGFVNPDAPVAGLSAFLGRQADTFQCGELPLVLRTRSLNGLGIAAVERRPRRLLALGIAFGAVEGLGFGMRTDMILNFVPFLLVLFAAPHATFVRGLATKLAVATAAAATFIAVSYPVVRTYTQNSSLWHVVLLGLTSPYDENLRIGFPRPAYSFPYVHNDGYIETVIRAYWSRLHPADPPLALVTRAY